MEYNIKNISKQFQLYGDFISAAPYGSGHINDTFRTIIDQGGKEVHYIIQRINKYVFKNPPALMENIERVTSHIFKKVEEENDPHSFRHSLYIVRSRDDKAFVLDDDGDYWRCYIFIENACTYDVSVNSTQAYEAARTFGFFQKDLVDLPGKRLYESIPDFHNTPKRLASLEKAITADPYNRVKEVGPEIDFIMSRRDDTSKLLNLQAAGEIEERITHNDTKLNNVMLDKVSGRGVCVIDLDTVMPGLVHYDFGDMLRSCTNPTSEDSQDPSQVYMQFDVFEALLRGYLSSAGDFLNPVERELLPFSGKLISMEIGIRFLTDYLEGDLYFKTHREKQNLDRCRVQLQLAASMEKQMDKMMALLHKI